MEVFGIIGMSFGVMAWIYAMNVSNDLAALRKTLRESGVLTEEESRED